MSNVSGTLNNPAVQAAIRQAYEQGLIAGQQSTPNEPPPTYVPNGPPPAYSANNPAQSAKLQAPSIPSPRTQQAARTATPPSVELSTLPVSERPLPARPQQAAVQPDSAIAQNPPEQERMSDDAPNRQSDCSRKARDVCLDTVCCPTDALRYICCCCCTAGPHNPGPDKCGDDTCYTPAPCYRQVCKDESINEGRNEAYYKFSNSQAYYPIICNYNPLDWHRAPENPI